MMIKLKTVKVHKYKSIQQTQVVEIEPDITTVVGMNESGKTSFLTAIAKTNYFNADKDFNFDITQDYPRNELIDFQHEDEDRDIIDCIYEISDALKKEINEELGEGVFTTSEFRYTCPYKSESNTSVICANIKKYLENQVKDYKLTKETKEKIIACTQRKNIADIEGAEEDEDLAVFSSILKKLYMNHIRLGQILLKAISQKIG